MAETDLYLCFVSAEPHRPGKFREQHWSFLVALVFAKADMRIGLRFRFLLGFFENEFLSLPLVLLPDEFHHRRAFVRILRSRFAI